MLHHIEDAGILLKFAMSSIDSIVASFSNRYLILVIQIYFDENQGLAVRLCFLDFILIFIKSLFFSEIFFLSSPFL